MVSAVPVIFKRQDDETGCFGRDRAKGLKVDIHCAQELGSLEYQVGRVEFAVDQRHVPDHYHVSVETRYNWLSSNRPCRRRVSSELSF